MDQFQMLSRGFPLLYAGPMEWVAIFLFVAIAVLYCLAPALGYRPERRGALAASLYLLVGYGAVTLVQFLLMYLQLLSRSSGDATGHMFFLFQMLKVLLFLVAMILFAVGLQALRYRGSSPPEDWRGGPSDRVERERGGWPENR
jgi:predicted membrane channel-forming protein YqfA (hemolysin III family)